MDLLQIELVVGKKTIVTKTKLIKNDRGTEQFSEDLKGIERNTKVGMKRELIGKGARGKWVKERANEVR